MQNAFNMNLLELIKLKNASAAKTLLRLSEDMPLLEEIPFKHMFL